jgi:prepilin signal peptidase PulO-like enzyme (type II secretory pathway)
MGLGDAKLMVGLGLLLGMALSPSGIILSFWLATFIVLGLMVLGTLSPIFPGFKPFKSLSRKSEVPLGPFLIAGCLIVFFLELNIFKFFMVF